MTYLVTTLEFIFRRGDNDADTEDGYEGVSKLIDAVSAMSLDLWDYPCPGKDVADARSYIAGKIA